MTNESTSERIIRTATRLFAEHGMDHVSLRQINVEAGQKNASALHYHFGSRLALIEAIFETHMRPLNVRREKMMDIVEQEGRSGNLHALIAVKLFPLMDYLTDRSDGRYYVSFLSQALSNPDVQCRQIVGGKLDGGLERVVAHVLAALPHLPASVVKARFRMLTAFITHALTDFLRYQAEFPEKQNSDDLENYFGMLIDMEVSALSAPVSAYSEIRKMTLSDKALQGV